MYTLSGTTRALGHVALAALLLATAACGGDKGGGPSGPSTPTPAAATAVAGDQQTGAPGAQLPIAPAVKVTDAAGAPVSGVGVTFTVTAGGGSLAGTSATTGGDGVATAGRWTLGQEGENRVRATVQGVAGSVQFRAMAEPVAAQREWTVLVYMAADNNLAISGIFDIDEMEEAARNPAVQFVVQAEFNKDALAQQDCDFRCFNRPNWNTFRYAVSGAGANVTGPNGSAIDIGDRNMVDPAQLREFIEWGKQTYPAERYAVVLWNHGGGYAGLLQDITTAGASLMSMSDLRTALEGVGTVDLLDFDMCLMGGYETLATLKGLAKYVVFSEEVVPGEGLPYKEVVQAFNAHAADDGRTIAGAIADVFHASYANSQPSTTISAYDMAAFDAFDDAMTSFADALFANAAVLAPEVRAAAAESQKYTYRELTDIEDFLDRLEARGNMGALQGSINALRAQTGAGFRLRTHSRNGSNTDGGDVSRSHGLHFVLPSGGEDDKLADDGPRSFAAYKALYPDQPWTRFLEAYLQAAQTSDVTDQGNRRFEAFLVWDPAAVAKNADVDLWIREPDGDIYSPAIGTVTPNGTLTGDSYDKGTSYEGYLTNRFIQNGEYLFLASLYADPQDFQPQIDFVYRQDPSADFTSQFEPDYPRLSMEQSWQDDPTPTDEELFAGSYSDLKPVALFTVGVPGIAAAGKAGTGVSASRASSTARLDAAPTERPTQRITAAQLATIRRALAARGPASANRGDARQATLSPSPRVAATLRGLSGRIR